MAFKLKLGATIPIKISLFDGATDKYVRAWVTKADGTALASSPFAVPHLSNGVYSLVTQVMPNSDFITVQYRVFDDALFATVSEDHSDALDIWGLEPVADLAAHISGSIESNTLIGTIEEC